MPVEVLEGGLKTEPLILDGGLKKQQGFEVLEGGLKPAIPKKPSFFQQAKETAGTFAGDVAEGYKQIFSSFQQKPTPEGFRADSTKKGLGYFGELKRPDGQVSTEISIGVEIDGKEIEIPTLVPTLTQDEINYLLKGGEPTDDIVDKAVKHAKERIKYGKSPFAQKGEQIKPAIFKKRIPVISAFAGDVKEGWKSILTQPKQALQDVINMPPISSISGAGEAVAGFVSFMGVEGLAGITGLRELVSGRGMEEAKKTIEETRERYRPMQEFLAPKTKEGQILSAFVSSPFTVSHELGIAGQEYWESKGHYKIGFIQDMLAESAPFLIPYAFRIKQVAKQRGTTPQIVAGELKTQVETIKEPSKLKTAIEKALEVEEVKATGKLQIAPEAKPSEVIIGKAEFELQQSMDYLKSKPRFQWTAEDKLLEQAIYKGFNKGKSPFEFVPRGVEIKIKSAIGERKIVPKELSPPEILEGGLKPTLEAIEVPKTKPEVAKAPEEALINKIDVKTGAEMLIEGKSIKQHIQEGLEAGKDVDTLSTQIREVLKSEMEKDKSILEQDKIKIMRNFEQQLADAYEGKITAKPKPQPISKFKVGDTIELESGKQYEIIKHLPSGTVVRDIEAKTVTIKDRTFKKRLAPIEISGDARGVKVEVAPKELKEATFKLKTEKPKPETTQKEVVINDLYEKGQKQLSESEQAGFIALPEARPQIKFKIPLIEKIKEKIGLAIKPLQFYKDLPSELRNAIRTDMIGGLQQVFEKRKRIEVGIWGDLLHDPKKLQQSVELIYARDQLARTKAGKGNPDITIEEAQKILYDVEKSITDPRVLEVADNWKKIVEVYREDLVERGKLDPEDFFDDYAPHYVKDYTPEWSPAFGIPTRLRRPFRQYAKQAVGTRKEYRKDAESLMDYVTSVEYDNMVEDFIHKQAQKYDITPQLSPEQKTELFKGRKQAKTGRIYEIEGKKYQAYNPDKPFTRKIIPVDVKFTEYVDVNLYDNLLRIAEDIGVTHERVLKAGRGKLGYATKTGDIVSQFATELNVLAHEIGHQLDFKYNLWDRIVKGATEVGKRGEITKTASAKKRGIIQDELRALADLTWEGQEVSPYYKAKVRKQPEKMAHMLEAYIHAPEKFREVAPTVFKDFDSFIRNTPEIKGLADIKQGLSLKRMMIKKDMGLFLGAEKPSYLIPQEIYKAFEGFSERGSKPLYITNQATGYWKTMAILSRFPTFNLNNLIGDTTMLLMQHPEPFKMLKEIDNSLSYLTKKPSKYTPFETEFNKFIIDGAIIDASFIHEIPKIYVAKNPLSYILQKARDVSEFRENIMRVANASYLFKQLKEGRGGQVRTHFDWINTEGLNTQEALGKIAREVLVDYNAQSKTYRRWIRGLALPFGTWYIKGTELIVKWGLKHPFKATAIMSALPIASQVFNNRDEKTKELEMQLPDNLRDSTHFVIGQTKDGTIRIFNLQTPFDALIGTKIFSIAYNQANMVLNGEKTIKEASVDTLKRWAVREVRGIAFLMNPVVRLITGLVNRKDPFDRQPVYPVFDERKLSSLRKNYYRSLYFVKTMTPMLTAYISQTQGKIRPPEIAIKEVSKNFIGWEALGFRDYNPKTETTLMDGRKIGYDNFEVLDEIGRKEAGIILDITESWIKSGVEPKKYYQSEIFKRHKNKLLELHKGTLTPETISSLEERIKKATENDLENNPDNYRFWISNKILATKNLEEKKKLIELEQKAKTWQMYEKFKEYPISIKPHLKKTIKQERR